MSSNATLIYPCTSPLCQYVPGGTEILLERGEEASLLHCAGGGRPLCSTVRCSCMVSNFSGRVNLFL